MKEFNATVSEASERGGRLSKASEACEALVVVASDSLILNISDGHKHGVLNINESDSLMEAIRVFAQENYTAAMAKVREAVVDG